MSLEILRDPRVRGIPWRDLRRLCWHEVVRELLIWSPWLLLSWVFASWALTTWGWWVAALACSFVFFLTGLRLIHDVFHHNLGLPRWVDDAVMATMSALMLGSMHAVQYNHLRHHRHCMDDEDIEAMSAKMPAWKAILWGPIFPLRLHHAAWVGGGRRLRTWMVVELSLCAIWGVLVFGVFEVAILRYHLLTMLVGQCLTAFFAVWTVHHDCDRSHYIARTLRGRWRTLTTFNMFYHVEHHLFPQLPTRRLPELAVRLDHAAPELQEKRVF